LRATERLVGLGELAEPGLRELLRSPPTPESYPLVVEVLRKPRKLGLSPESLRVVRAIEVPPRFRAVARS
jgi:hypothetical protein